MHAKYSNLVDSLYEDGTFRELLLRADDSKPYGNGWLFILLNSGNVYNSDLATLVTPFNIRVTPVDDDWVLYLADAALLDHMANTGETDKVTVAQHLRDQSTAGSIPLLVCDRPAYEVAAVWIAVGH